MKRLLAIAALALSGHVHADPAQALLLIPLIDSLTESVGKIRLSSGEKRKLEGQIEALRERVEALPPAPVYPMKSTERFQTCVAEVKDDLDMGVRPLCYCSEREGVSAPEIRRSCPRDDPPSSADQAPAKDPVEAWLNANCQIVPATDEGTIYTANGGAVRVLRGERYYRCAK